MTLHEQPTTYLVEDTWNGYTIAGSYQVVNNEATMQLNAYKEGEQPAYFNYVSSNPNSINLTCDDAIMQDFIDYGFSAKDEIENLYSQITASTNTTE